MKLLANFKLDFINYIFIFLISLATVFDWFLNPGRSANMDGIVHTLTPNLFYMALRGGEIPIGWVDGFANYGLPLGIVAHQLTTYLTAIMQFIVGSPEVAFNVVSFLGFCFSFLFFYIFLRFYFDEIISFTGGLIFHLSAYRILNIYIRGALPEFFSGVFVPLILISLYLLIQKKNIWGIFILSVSTALLALTHPFMIVISGFLAGPYLLYLLVVNNLFSFKKYFSLIKNIFLVIFFVGLGIGIAGYFLIPLFLEIKYFYYGLTPNHLTPGNFLSLYNYIDPRWYYYTKINILPRGFVVNFGILESVIIFFGILMVILSLVMKIKLKNKYLLYFALINSFILIFLTSGYSASIYKLNFLAGIQFPWRFFSVLIFLPSIILCVILQNIKFKLFFVFVFIIFMGVARFPQLYGKNYVVYSKNYYSFTNLNLHATVLNPIWTGRSEDYPIKKEKPEIIEGEGKIIEKNVKNSSRKYIVLGTTPLKMVDYTFYFPGWNLYIDNNPAPIEFQDPNYRGVITYQVPAGKHTIDLKFEDTKVRKLGKIVSAGSIMILAMLFLFRNRIKKLFI